MRPSEWIGQDEVNEVEDLDPPVCSGCHNEIDPEWCWCGGRMRDHGYGDGHSPVPMGCVCGYGREDQVDA